MILDIDTRELIDGGCHIRLSRLECALIEALARSPSGLSNVALVRFLWNGDAPDSARTIPSALIGRINKKLTEAGRCPLIINRYGLGYRLTAAVDIRVAGIALVVIPGHLRPVLESLLYSHPDRVSADRVLASIVGLSVG
jgi:DNA-binding winged helix-turn-helix (wHTH) protein